jgi:hypothetical protein
MATAQHPALALDFWKIRFDRLPLHAVLAFERALAGQMTADQAEHLRQLIQARRDAGERPATRGEIEAAHAARIAEKRAAKRAKVG